MSGNVKPIPEGFHTVTPYLIMKDAAEAIEFYKRAFAATEQMRIADPSGKVGHAELRIGDSTVMLAEEHPQMNIMGPKSLGGTPVSLMLYVENVDEVAKRAEAAGARVLRPIEDKFYGDRMGSLRGSFRPRVARGHAHRRCLARGNAAPCSGRNGRQELAVQLAQHFQPHQIQGGFGRA